MKNIIYTIFTIFSLFVVTQKIHAGEQGCAAGFSYSVDYSVSSLTYQFVDQSSSNNTIISWYWNFGDSSTSSNQNPEHQYLNEGNYVVSLFIKCSDGSMDTHIDTVKVAMVIPPSCTSNFTYLTDSVNPMKIHFTDHSVSPNDTIISWQWNFGDLSVGSSLQNPTHLYASVGTYYLSLSINTSGGCSSVFNDSITISTIVPSCNANFSFKADSVSGNPNAIFFYDQSTAADPIISWEWHFGDGVSSQNQNPTHIFPYAGIYDISLEIKTQSGCKSSTHYPIQVGNPQRYNMWGRVYLGIQTTDQCIAYLYKEFSNGYIVPIDTVRLTSVNDTLGVYYFYQILEGVHKVKVLLPESSNYDEFYAPTYYGDKLFWNKTSAMNLFQDMSMANVNLEPVNQQKGNSKISGTVYQKGSTNPKEGIQILLLSSSKQVYGYTFSDNAGNYSFEDVPSGLFYLYAELTGLYAFPAQLNVQAYDTLTNVNITLSNTQAVTAIEENNKILPSLSLNIYPNPVSEFLHLDFEKPNSSIIHYQIMNSLGQFIEQGSFEAGSQKNILNLSSLRSGFYIIHLNSTSGESVATKKFIKK